jgi:hypothetical protein
MAIGKDDDDVSELKSAVERLQAEMEWVKAMLTGQRPEATPQKTSPPWVTTAALLGVPILTALIATKPWA